MSEAIKVALHSQWNLSLTSLLGSGRDGEVYLTNHNTAIKLFIEEESFSRELVAYERLAVLSIVKVAGHAVPKFLRAQPNLRAIEMSVVAPPFLLDFASAYFTADVPDFSEEVWEEWRQQKQEEFGDRWPDVQFVLSEFQRLTGLVILDTNPGNIRF
jgi:hypothetical protein